MKFGRSAESYTFFGRKQKSLLKNCRLPFLGYLSRLLSGVICLAVPLFGFALGLGKLYVYSGINQNFNGQIALIDVGETSVDSIIASLAPTQAYQQANLSVPSEFNAFQFQVLLDRKGRWYIQINSVSPIQAPILNLFVYLRWADGALSRNYTVLLDPVLQKQNNKKPLFRPMLNAEKKKTDLTIVQKRAAIEDTADQQTTDTPKLVKSKLNISIENMAILKRVFEENRTRLFYQKMSEDLQSLILKNTRDHQQHIKSLMQSNLQSISGNGGQWLQRDQRYILFLCTLIIGLFLGFFFAKKVSFSRIGLQVFENKVRKYYTKLYKKQVVEPILDNPITEDVIATAADNMPAHEMQTEKLEKAEHCSINTDEPQDVLHCFADLTTTQKLQQVSQFMDKKDYVLAKKLALSLVNEKAIAFEVHIKLLELYGLLKEEDSFYQCYRTLLNYDLSKIEKNLVQTIGHRYYLGQTGQSLETEDMKSEDSTNQTQLPEEKINTLFKVKERKMWKVIFDKLFDTKQVQAVNADHNLITEPSDKNKKSEVLEKNALKTETEEASLNGSEKAFLAQQYAEAGSLTEAQIENLTIGSENLDLQTANMGESIEKECVTNAENPGGESVQADIDFSKNKGEMDASVQEKALEDLAASTTIENQEKSDSIVTESDPEIVNMQFNFAKTYMETGEWKEAKNILLTIKAAGTVEQKKEADLLLRECEAHV